MKAVIGYSTSHVENVAWNSTWHYAIINDDEVVSSIDENKFNVNTLELLYKEGLVDTIDVLEKLIKDKDLVVGISTNIVYCRNNVLKDNRNRSDLMQNHVYNKGVCQYLDLLPMELRFHIATNFNKNEWESAVYPCGYFSAIDHNIWTTELRWDYVEHVIKMLKQILSEMEA